MKLAIHLGYLSWSGGSSALVPTLTAIARAADKGGFSTLTMMDHYFQMENQGGPTEPMLEGYTTLGFLAGQTTNIELGLLVTGVTYRYPGLLAKIVSTLDVLSSGRAMLGLGAAWYGREHSGLGVPFPPLTERYQRLEEALQICQQMWSENNGPFTGTYYQLAETICIPQPVRKPRPPILIGGSGERQTLRIVAHYADACNLFPGDLDEIKHKLEVLDHHCEAAKRNPSEIERTIFASTDPLDNIDDFLTTMKSYAALGISKVWTGPPNDIKDPVQWVNDVGNTVIPRLHSI